MKELEKALASVACTAQLYPEEDRVLVSRLAQAGAPVSNWKAEVDKLFDGYLCHYEVDPHKVKALLQPGASRQATGEVKVLVCQGDITKQEADVLVNAANEDLEHTGGVAAALSKAGGPEVQKECRALVKQWGKVPTGRVVSTTGGNLNCKSLLHAVGPVGGKSGGRERILLEAVIQSALNSAESMGSRSIAIPCISSGVFGVPVALSTSSRPVTTEGLDQLLSRYSVLGSPCSFPADWSPWCYWRKFLSLKRTEPAEHPSWSASSSPPMIKHPWRYNGNAL
uniref:Macro domain-containing protein n=1 Tax=Gasterosteus aculeatus aculeatus TaxID=481459 RepID=G3Q5C5_GASAC